MSIWLALASVVAALIVGFVFGTRMAGSRVSLPELARLWEAHLVQQYQGEYDEHDAPRAYHRGLREMARALVIGDVPPSDRR